MIQKGQPIDAINRKTLPLPIILKGNSTGQSVHTLTIAFNWIHKYIDLQWQSPILQITATLRLMSYHDIVLRLLKQVHTSLGLCKLSDANTVGWMKLLLKKDTACLCNLIQLQEAGRWKQALNSLLSNLQMTLKHQSNRTSITEKLTHQSNSKYNN